MSRYSFESPNEEGNQMSNTVSRTTDAEVRAEIKRFIKTGNTIEEIAAGARISNVSAVRVFFEEKGELSTQDRARLVSHLFGW